MGPGGGPGRGRGPRATGKPKNLGATVKRLLGYVGNYKWLFLVVLLCMLLNTVFTLLGTYIMAPIINRLTLIVAPETEINPSYIEVWADGVIEAFTSLPFMTAIMGSDAAAIAVYIATALIILACIYAVSILTSYLQARMMLAISQSAIEKIRLDLFNKMQKLPIKYFDSRPTGEIMSRFTNDIDNIDMMLNNSLTSIISGVVSLIGTLFFMLSTNIWLSLVTLAFIPIFMIGASTIAKLSGKYYKGQQAALGALNGYIEETISGQKVMKVFNHEGECVEEFALLNEDLRTKQFLASFFGGITGPVIGNTSQVCFSVTVGVGGILMFTTGLTPGALTLFAGYSKQFARPIDMIAMQMSTIFSALAGAERVFAVMDETPEKNEADGTVSEPIEGDVRLEDVSFGYVEGQTVLDNISLYAHPGQKIAFVGSTGAGKTTITNLLNRFYDVEEGSITIDSRPIRDYDRDFLRENIAMVLQDTHLFTGTVMENIRYGRLDATDEEVIEAAKTASAHSFIIRLENGYDTVLEGDGANLSQGQRQLLNIARAALSRAPILVLDEATSSVDTRTERHIEVGMDRLMKNRTTFVIAHRLSTVRNSNAIMVLEKGRIIERGTHEDLLAMKGRYYELYTGKCELS
ncbi:MAG: ABC transporter ATP-binding protein [Clostridia bacterium]|nr:ABC transporter ATP-binding protein [Clostridia bacterium]